MNSKKRLFFSIAFVLLLLYLLSIPICDLIFHLNENWKSAHLWAILIGAVLGLLYSIFRVVTFKRTASESSEAKKKNKKKTIIRVTIVAAIFVLIYAIITVYKFSLNVNVYEALNDGSYIYEDDEIEITVRNDGTSEDPILAITKKADNVVAEYRITKFDDKDSKYALKHFSLYRTDNSIEEIWMNARKFFGGSIEIKITVSSNRDFDFLMKENFVLTRNTE